ncbi:MAG: aconitate hydratase AcnA [Proteobacteria bacterium]|nr:aconitate hydratase AcnA [Pseudomonadota bacterium]
MADIQSPKDSFGALSNLKVGGAEVHYFRLDALAERGVADVSLLPFSVKVVLEAVLRGENGQEITEGDVAALAAYNPADPPRIEVPYKPARVLLQDFTGVPAVVDLAAMRSAMDRLGGDPRQINPRIPVDLVADHSIQIDEFGTKDAILRNTELEFIRNRERYEFLRWGQHAFNNFRVVPPANGICHQVNLEYLARVVQKERIGGLDLVFPDTLIGTDSHTPMIGGLGVLGWGVGGIEAEAVMLGQPLYILAPPVVGMKLVGSLPKGSTATDLVLTVTELLRKKGVVGRFVEFYGPGLGRLTVADRATVANMAPEYGATVGYCPVDEQTLSYLVSTGRPKELVDLVEHYCKAQGLFRSDDTPEPRFSDTIELDLGTVKTCLAGPKRPQDRIGLPDMKTAWKRSLCEPIEKGGYGIGNASAKNVVQIELQGGSKAEISHGSVAIASITSCTNTSNPQVMITAGLLAKKAVERGLKSKPWVKTSLAPGSTVVTEYLKNTGLLPHLEKLGFHVVGYGCATCIGNSGPLPGPVARAVKENSLVMAGVLSGNRNFEGRINPDVVANYLASPPLVVAYALAGTVDIDLSSEPLGTDRSGDPVYLADIWPLPEEISASEGKALTPEMFVDKYTGIEDSNEEWNAIPISSGEIFEWNKDSNYIQEPPFFTGMSLKPRYITSIENARVLIMVGDSITTDHISPAGAIPPDGPAGKYLVERGVEPYEFNSFGSRRGNDRVMTRGTFANIRFKNQLAPGTEGGWTTYLPTGEVTSVYEAAEKYRSDEIHTIVLAGKDYGMGSSRDWAAKGARLLGVRAVIAESFERIHRSNLVGMGVLPLQFENGQSVSSLGLTGKETFLISIDDNLKQGQKIEVKAELEGGATRTFETLCRIDTPQEVHYYRNGGILQAVLKGMLVGQSGKSPKS